jgi:hypothetical protein
MKDQPELEIILKKEARRERILYCIKQIFLYTSTIVFITLSIWFMIWITKEISYKYIYKDKVEKTIIEMIKPEYLKNYNK